MTTRTPRPRKKRTIVEEEIPASGAGSGFEEEPTSEFDISLESVEDTETLKDVLEQFGQRDNVLYRIYRQTPTGPSFCYESPTFDEAFLQRERGQGAYTVRIFINQKFKKSINIQVDAPTNGTTAPDNHSNGNSHSQFLEKMVMVLLTNMAQGGNNHGPSLTDMTAALANLDGLRGKQENVMDTFIKGLQMGKDFGEGGGSLDWKSELLKMGRDALPAITNIVQAKMGETPAPIQPQHPENVPVNLATLTTEQKQMMLRQAIAAMKKQCFMGLDAESALNFIVTNAATSEEYQAIIKEVIAVSFEDLVKIDAEIGKEPFHVFFRTLYDGLRSEFGGEDSVDGDPGGNPGNDRNT